VCAPTPSVRSPSAWPRTARSPTCRERRSRPVRTRWCGSTSRAASSRFSPRGSTRTWTFLRTAGGSPPG
jgi:hypothetical protein